MKQEKDIMLDADNDLKITDGDFVVDDSLLQDIGLILPLNQGELKSDPILGPGLIRKIKSKVSPSAIQQLVRKHLSRDGKDYDAVKNIINEVLKTK